MKFKVFLVSMLFSTLAFSAGFAPVANVVKIKGTAFINKEKIKVGAEIATGMEISIPNKTDFIEVKFQNGHIIRMAGAKVIVEDITPKSTLFSLVKGKIFSFVKPLTTGETFVIKTNRASMGVRGTKFFIDESQKETYLCVCDGTVVAKTPNEEIAVEKDKDLFVSGSKPSKLVDASKRMLDMGNKTFKDMGVD
jgi:hypothetical protein